MDFRPEKFLDFFKKIRSLSSSLFSFSIKFFNREKAFGSAQLDLDKKLVYSLAKAKIPNWRQIKYLKNFLSAREILAVRISLAIIVFCSIFLGARFYNKRLETLPDFGGKYIEGLVGAPKYINPIYSEHSDVDADLARLIFSSLFKRGEDGRLINDLAENYELSADGREYKIKLRAGAKWHHGSPLTVADVLFTFNLIKDERYNSPLRYNFSGVSARAEENSIIFSLSEPYAVFPELLTFGILPEDLWSQIPPASATLADLNLKPSGSGPYKLKSLVKDKVGHVKSYNLEANKEYYGQKPYISEIDFKFFPGFEEAISALNSGAIDGLSYLPKSLEDLLIAKDSLALNKINLPQLKAVFFNQARNKNLSSKKIRQALSYAVNKDVLLSEILKGDAKLAYGPILSDNFAYNQEVKKYQYSQTEAEKLLEEEKWQLMQISPEDIAAAEKDLAGDDEKKKKAAEKKIFVGPGAWRTKDGEYLMVKLTTVEIAENQAVVEAIKSFWEKIGVKTVVEIIPAAKMRTDIIKPRNFEALFYGQVLGTDPDSYAFWHSSQAGGANITGYADNAVDKLLEEARLISDQEERKAKYKKFQEIVAEDAPAIFLYSPIYTYVQGKKIKGFSSTAILVPSDRFSGAEKWHIKTKKEINF